MPHPCLPPASTSPHSPLPAQRPTRRLLAACTLMLLATGLALAQAPRNAPPLPPLRIVAPEARLPVRVQRATVQAEIVGLAAATRVELVLHNPNHTELQAELQFPLHEGQAVTGFALDIDGVLRDAVPVEKSKGRQVFEDVVRGRVDPALLEATQGNSYKLQVYPLPPRGQRRVVLEIRETLSAAARPAWRLPLAFGRDTVDALDVSVQVAGVAPRQLAARLGAQRLQPAAHAGGTRVTLARNNYQGAGELRIELPVASGQPLVGTELFRDQRYFHAEVPVAAQEWPRTAPRRVALLWDASASGAQRDHAREFALLEAWFRTLPEVEVLLVPVRNEADAVERHTVRGGDWAALRRRLEGMVYDGATHLGAMQPPAEADLALLFTDGLGNWGATGLPTARMPLFALSAASRADARTLRHAAEASGGVYLDLLATPPAQVLRALTHERLRVASVRAEGARELELASAYPLGGRVALAGVLTEPQARIVLELSAPDGTRQTRTLQVGAAPDAQAERLRAGQAIAVAAHRWASLRIARLEADYTRQRKAIERIGMEFGMATRETSLLVLDRAEDYVRFDVEPPAPLRAQWETLVARKVGVAQRAEQQHLARIAQRFADKVAWWERDFPKDTPPPPPPRPTAAMGMTMAPPPAPAPAGGSAGPTAPAEPRPASIQLRKWQPDEPYTRRLRAAKDEDLYAVYLDERPAYTQSSAFYLDVADILVDRKQTGLAIRVLSNLAEMDIENRHLLRILAYRLLLAQRVPEALPVLEEVLRLAPDEPQSYRDLGLALAQGGQPQRAVDMLWEVVARPWNDRFPDVELIALAELNAIAAQSAAAGQPLDLSSVDPRLQRNLPLDLRAVLSWDADNTDIDLWVIDPNGERAYYGNRLTYQGGRMSRDFIGGYGPEEFSLKHAKPGTYTVRAQFYGHRQQIVAPATTLMLRLSTGFGSPAQKDQSVVLRLSGRGEQITVGTFTIAPSSPPPASP